MKIDYVTLLYSAQALSPILGFIAHYLVVKDAPKQNHLIFYYLALCFFADGFAFFGMIPTPIIFNLHDIGQFLIITTLYVMLFQKRAVYYLVITIVLYVVGITATITVMGMTVYHNYMWALSALLISIISVVYLSVHTARPTEFANNKDVYNTLVMNASFLFYFLSTFAFFLFVDLIFKKMTDDWIRITWLYHNAIGLIKNLGLAIAILLTGRAKVPEPAQSRHHSTSESIRL